MKKLLLAALLWAYPAQAQFATTTTTPPNGDNSTRIASTAFVQAAFAGGSTIPLTQNFLLVGSAGNLAVGVPLSGDCTIVSSGAITCTKTNGVVFATLATKVSPVCADLTNSQPSCSTDTTNANNITSGTVNTARISGAYTGITQVGTLTSPLTIGASGVGQVNAGQLQGPTGANLNVISGAGQTVTLQVSGASAGVFVQSTPQIVPSSDNTVNNGSAAARWSDLQSVTSHHNSQVFVGATSGTMTMTASATGGHTSFASSSTPSLTAGCNGAGSSVSGTDVSGTVTGQTAAATTCTLTFGTAFGAAPNCVVTGLTTPLTGTTTINNAAFSVNFASAANYKFTYFCPGV